MDRDAVESAINGAPANPFWVGRYLTFSELKPEDRIEIVFPMVETLETYTLKWKEADFWQESTNPGSNWKPKAEPDRFTFTIRGNTVVDVSPRKETDEYRFYERDHLKSGKAPLKKVTRFVSSASIRW